MKWASAPANMLTLDGARTLGRFTRTGWAKRELVPKLNKVSVADSREYAWQCNECGSNELSSTVGEDQLQYFACGRCGCNEFHKVAIS